MKILQVCAYAGTFAGNFINSLLALEHEVKKYGYNSIYVLPETIKSTKWCMSFMADRIVYFLPVSRARICPKTYYLLYKIYHQHKDIALVHSHFELYDIPATILAPKGVKIFWHLHDPIQIEKNLRGILNKFQYSVISKRAFLISVAEKYRKDMVAFGFKKENTTTVLNGIDLKRISIKNKKERIIKYDFLTFGANFDQKGDDYIIQAANRLHKEGYEFRLLLNGNAATWKKLNEYTAGKMPTYLVTSNPVDDVNELFATSRVFIQASRQETFSYAIGEAAYAGLPVIASDIAGVEWAHNVPNVDFFEKADVEGLYQLMKRYLDGFTISQEVIDLSREVIQKMYSIDVWVANILNCYQIGK